MGRTALAGIVVGMLIAPAAIAAERPVVVELFTSEGCSSCPPADALLGELARSRPDVLPLAFHVTYWDRLGWPDPFALSAATRRQEDYARAMRLDTIYTPQAVIDGVHDVVGSDRDGVEGAIRLSRAAAAPSVPLTLARDAAGLVVTVGGGAGMGRLLVVGYDPLHSTPVRRGENAGRLLTEANIVRGLSDAGDWAGAPLSRRVPAPAGLQLAVLLQAADGRVLGAARLSE